ncbi:hypothetical protein [Chryseobacterium sp. ISL-6]|uniref:hypothetical protein n=1 Tax=Chryseobacterium sp. ISL-6 TaxID=2819143 RepID=UPI001BEA9308|nr:hypothetical protein [Chryseobacterium sp. ISL-6]MBT2620303.1 hypothetical protein [Chryseobacterium sp. ISL-6]
MNPYTFRELELTYGEFIYLINEGGEGLSGVYEGEYDNTNETFKFNNSSNGISETIYIEKLQLLKRIN